MAFSLKLQEIREGFQPAFWVANITELFERLSYYGVNAVLAIYLHETLKFSQQQTGELIGFFGGVVWFLPIIGGTLADRLGFRRSLAGAYLVLALGYFLLGSLSASWMAPLRNALPLAVVVQLILCVPALGPAIVKPCVVGTTARAAAENVRSLGYSVYYTLVNIGGTLGPMMAFAVRRTIGIENVFRVSAVSVLLMFFGTVFFYREPDRLVEKQVASFAQAFRNMFVVLVNWRFMGFLLIFSGFWIMFWQEFIALPLFIRGYVNPNADVDLMTTVDPLAVILFQILISFLTRKVRPFTAMIAGILITSLSWVILAVCNLGWQVNATMRIGGWHLPIQGLPVYAVFALVILAIGEMVQSPRYYEYVSRLAPPGQQGTFMGFSFLPIAIGFVIAGKIGGRLVNYFGEVIHRPTQLWYVIAGIGIATTLLMWIYDRLVKPAATPAQ
ncbi:MAG TPA: MFS transporter [Acidobacteriota bacterium]|nr:MFS transporter [Acidobacteriota bacterium]